MDRRDIFLQNCKNISVAALVCMNTACTTAITQRLYEPTAHGARIEHSNAIGCYGPSYAVVIRPTPDVYMSIAEKSTESIEINMYLSPGASYKLDAPIMVRSSDGAVVHSISYILRYPHNAQPHEVSLMSGLGGPKSGERLYASQPYTVDSYNYNAKIKIPIPRPKQLTIELPRGVASGKEFPRMSVVLIDKEIQWEKACYDFR